MQRVLSISPGGAYDNEKVVDRVILDADDRRRRRIVLTGEKGTQILLDLEKPVLLRNGDALILEDGSIVRVCGQPEPLVEIKAFSPREFMRLAWHLGNRHSDVQIAGDRLRIRRDHVLEGMAADLGATVTPIEAPFDPEARSLASHDHGHDYGT